VARVLAALGEGADYRQANVTSEADWAMLAAHMEARGACHILVNNAGTDLTGAVESLSLEAWRKIMAVNVDGVFLGTRALVPLMAKSGADVPAGRA
jgi:NAD(P)-dependent dehydrogenase (short-subunit alcohol dehydrogenase family)